MGGKEYDMYFRSINGNAPTRNLESLQALTLLPCMKTGGDPLISEGRVSSQFSLNYQLFKTYIANRISLASE
jgi:hypothetical protein